MIIKDVPELEFNSHDEIAETGFAGDIIACGIASSLTGEQLKCTYKTIVARSNFFTKNDNFGASLKQVLESLNIIHIALDLDPENSPPQYDKEDAETELSEVSTFIKDILENIKDC